MSGHLDDDYLSAPAVAACFNAEAMSRHMLAFEAALAAVGGELGVIPPAAVSVIARCADRFVPDYLALREATVAASNPAIPLVAALTAAVAAEDPEAARYVHWGATSQDVMDTATMLAARAAGVHLERELERVCALLSALADRHRATLLAARTLAQLAGPTTFGLRAAGWLAGLAGAQARLRALLPRLPVQCGGACGTLAAFGDAGAEVPARLAGRLGLAPSPPWHTERGMVRELAATLADICAAAGKVGSDLVLMMQREVGELREAAAPGRGGSSALPHKRNPVAAIAVVACARRAPGELATVFSCFDQWHERAAGAWHAETPALVSLAKLTGGSLVQLVRALDGLEVDVAAMRRHLDADGGVAMSEAVSTALAPALGRAAAQALVRRAAAQAHDSSRPFGEVLAEYDAVRDHLGVDGLADALDPGAFLGAADHFVAQALARAGAPSPDLQRRDRAEEDDDG